MWADVRVDTTQTDRQTDRRELKWWTLHRQTDGQTGTEVVDITQTDRRELKWWTLHRQTGTEVAGGDVEP